MQIQIQSVNFDADVKLRNFIQSKYEKLSQFHDKVIHVETFLKVENNSTKVNKTVETKVLIPGDEIMVKKTSKSFEEATDKSLDSLVKTLKRKKEKRQEKFKV